MGSRPRAPKASKTSPYDRSAASRGKKKAQMPACDPSAATLKLEPSNFKLDLPYDPSAAIRSTFTMALRPNAQNPCPANYAESTTRKKSVTHLTSANGALFFTADDGVHGVQLWKYVPEPVTNGRPVLKIARAGNQVALSWPADGSGYTLEQKGDLSSSLNWSQVPGTPTIVSGNYTVSASLTSTNTFYRLKR